MLKTTNYKTEKIGITLPVAYAILDGLHCDKNQVCATFGVYESRSQSSMYNAIEKKTIRFTWDRISNLAEQAYQRAKQVGGIFEGWQDDIVL